MLIVLFWLIAWLSAIYLRAAIFPNNGLLIMVSSIDVFLLYTLSLTTFYFLRFIPDDKFTKKLISLFLTVLFFGGIRFWFEALQMGYWKNSIIEIAPRMIVAKILSSVVIFGISLAYFLGEKFVDAKEQKMNFEMEKKQLELDFLKSRVNPHFLFNMLSNIHGLAQFKSDKTAPMIEGLSHLMRYMFYDCQQDKIALTKEISFISSYIKLNQLKSDKDLAITFDYKTQEQSFRIDPLIFVSFIENAFKHGNVFQGGFVHIKLYQDKDKVDFYCQNSFVELTSIPSISEQSGFGLKNIKKRLFTLYPDTHKLMINKNINFTVQLSLTIS